MCLTWYFTGKAPAGLGDLFRATAVTQCLVVVPVIPLVPALLRAALNHFLHGEVSDWFCSPISNSVGLQIHLITDPISPNWSANFLIYSYKLYIFSSVKEETQSLLGIYFLSSLSSALSDWVPRCHTFLPKRHSYVATVKKKKEFMCICLVKKTEWKPNVFNKLLPHCSWFTFQWFSGSVFFLSILISLWCCVTINNPALSSSLMKACGLIQGSSKTCRLSILYCNLVFSPSYFLCPVCSPFIQTWFHRIAQIFPYSLGYL